MNRDARQPDSMRINGTMRCGYSLIIANETIISFKSDFVVNRLLEDHFCRPWRNVSRPDKSEDQCNRGNETIGECLGWNPCLSSTRIRDGTIDCLNPRDEVEERGMAIETSCGRVRRHRFHCSRQRPTCLSVIKLGGSNYQLSKSL